MAFTPLLGLSLPVTGTLSGTWGDEINNSITSLVDSAVAGTTTLSTDADVTLTTTSGVANTAREAILLCTGARTGVRYITAPAQSKTYTVINATTGGYNVYIRGAGPTAGIAVPMGYSVKVAWNGSDFVQMSVPVSNVSGLGTGVATALGISVGTAGSPVVNGGALGTPSSGTLTSATGLPISTGVSGLGTGVATALAVNVGTAGAPVVNGGALGTPSSGTVTNLTGTANITATGGASGAIAATTLSASSTVSGTGFSTYLASPPAIGGTAAAAVSATALSYSTTLTGGTGIVNLGSGQFYKDASGNVGIGTSSPYSKLHVSEGANTTVTLGSTPTTGYYSQVFQNGNNLDLIANGDQAYRVSLGTNNGSGVLRFFTASGTTGNTESMRIDASGNVTVSTAALLGYGTGSGGTVTQATSKATAVTLNKPTGQITMNNAALAAGATVVFNLNNTLLSSADIVITTLQFPGSGNYQVWVTAMVAGTATIAVQNISTGSLSETPVIIFAVIKGATS